MRQKILYFVALFVLLCAVFCIGYGIFEESTQRKKYNEAMVILPDNTLVIGNLQYYESLSNGRMYELHLNEKTYLVPYSRITLIANDM